MAGITDKWVRHLRTRDRQDKAESHSVRCGICGDEIKTSIAWLDHAKSDQEHLEKWPTLEAAQLAYVHKAPNRRNNRDSISRKRRADTTNGTKFDQDRNADGHQAKRRSPGPSAPGLSPTRNDHRNDGGRPHQNTSGRQLWTSDDGVQQKSQGRGRAAMHHSSGHKSPKANRPTQPAAQQVNHPSSNDDESTSKMMRQPETRPISQDQLVAEVKGIYAGLVMVETKCIEVDNAQSSNTDANSKLNNEQWQALIALHRTLLHEHHDFFLASEHPSASPALRKLASNFSDIASLPL
ncbi:uncharacterized protein FFNC_15580 [Fusarium fujikuroi]|nr:uncharacterized protein FFNC_15580 [Fusarium fujikuroi]